jgi:hypothetical protein
MAQNLPIAPSVVGIDGTCAQAGPRIQAGVTICGNNDDFILDAPNPSTNNVGFNYTGVSRVSSVLGNAWPHACDNQNPGPPTIDNPLNCTTVNPAGAPPIVGTGLVAQTPFDTCAGAVIPCTNNQLGPRNSERRYAQDPNIQGTNNDPFGTFILRYRYTPSSALQGIRWRIDDLSTLCGGQTGTTTVIATSPNPPGTPQLSTAVGTQEARNLRGPDFSTVPAQTPAPSCQGEGSESPVAANFFTAILKGVNHYGEIVVDSSGTARIVAGSVLEDDYLSPALPPATSGKLAPFGGGSNASFVVNTQSTGVETLNVAPAGQTPITLIGDGVSGGTGRFGRTLASGQSFPIAFKFGVVRSGRFKILLGREATMTAPVVP